MGISETAKEYGRGIVGGLLFSLPLLYTMEVWWTGFTASPEKLLAFVGFTFLLLLGYNKHSGMRKDATLKDILHESIEDIALAFTVAFLFLLLINKINFNMPLREIAGKVIVESMIVAIGVSVGTAQLGQEKKREASKEGEGILQMIVLSLCGAALISSSVAPTEEILKIAMVSGPAHLMVMILISIGLSALILFFSDFKGTGSFEGGSFKMIVHLIISYMCALAISLVLLWFFGRVSGHGWSLIIAQTIVLAIPASLGASAGRMLIG
ncbi:TIGR02587 family membrane protein [Salinimicrobium terrae]|uniref:TIGR02587 family membrane protein n=1 Tax=Salinimicrobium terrae TaxID=470866 RepID=UPI0003F92853|nr:TIGR02587 family membrane protein [Salinimicrobium terrae]